MDDIQDTWETEDLLFDLLSQDAEAPSRPDQLFTDTSITWDSGKSSTIPMPRDVTALAARTISEERTEDGAWMGFDWTGLDLDLLPTTMEGLPNDGIVSQFQDQALSKYGAFDLLSVGSYHDSPIGDWNAPTNTRKSPPSPPPSCRAAEPRAPRSWGSATYNGQLLFSYTVKGQWLLDRCFDARQLREYVTHCPPSSIFWVQQAPTGSVYRLDEEDRLCRWAGCPVANRRITAGWLRVAFDETPAQTSAGLKDALKVAGSLHLWCFEQVLDPLEFHMSGRLRPESRKFPREQRSTVTLEKLTDAGIVREAYLPWMEARTREWRVAGPLRKRRAYCETLSYALNRYHLDNQTAARQRARAKRNAHRTEAERRTIDVHVGDLGVYTQACRKARHVKKRNRLGGRDDRDSNGNKRRTTEQHEDGERTAPEYFDPLGSAARTAQPVGQISSNVLEWESVLDPSLSLFSPRTSTLILGRTGSPTNDEHHVFTHPVPMTSPQ